MGREDSTIPALNWYLTLSNTGIKIGCMKGKKHTEETKSKMRKTALKTRDERIKNLSKSWGWNKGLTKETDERVKKMSINHKGVKFSKKVRKAMSERMKKRLADPRNHPRWKGGRKKHGAGYIQIRMPKHPRANPSNYVLEHIVVWENAHGKPLPVGMVIHHLNGIKDDNREEHLIAMYRKGHSPLTILKPYIKRIRELEKKIQEFPEK